LPPRGIDEWLLGRQKGTVYCLDSGTVGECPKAAEDLSARRLCGVKRIESAPVMGRNPETLELARHRVQLIGAECHRDMCGKLTHNVNLRARGPDGLAMVARRCLMLARNPMLLALGRFNER